MRTGPILERKFQVWREVNREGEKEVAEKGWGVRILRSLRDIQAVVSNRQLAKRVWGYGEGTDWRWSFENHLCLGGNEQKWFREREHGYREEVQEHSCSSWQCRFLAVLLPGLWSQAEPVLKAACGIQLLSAPVKVGYRPCEQRSHLAMTYIAEGCSARAWDAPGKAPAVRKPPGFCPLDSPFATRPSTACGCLVPWG